MSSAEVSLETTSPVSRSLTPTIVRASILGTLAITPLLCVPYILADNFPTPKLAFILVTTTIAVALALRHWLIGGSRSIPWGFAGVVGMMIAPLFSSWLLSPYRAWALWGHYQRYQGLIPMLVVASFAMVAAVYLQGRVASVHWAIAGAGALMGAYAILQWADLDPITWPERVDYAFSTTGNSNFTAAYLAMATCCLPALWKRARTPAFVLAMALAIGGGLVAAHSAAAYGAALGGLAVALGAGPFKRWVLARTAALVIPLSLAFVLSAVVPLSEVQPVIAETVGVQATERAYFWQAAAGMASEHLLTGRGPDAYAIEAIRHRPVANAIQKGYQFASEPHSVPLSVLTSAGLFGLAGLVIAAMWVTRRTVQIAKGRDDDFLGAGLSGAAVAYLLASFVSIDDISIRIAFWGILAALAAHGVATPDQPAATLRSGRAIRVVATAGVAAAVAVATWAGAALLTSDNAALRATEQFNAGDVSQSFASFERALSFRDHIVYREYYGERLGALARVMGSEGRPHLDAMRREFGYLESIPDVIGFVKLGTALYRWAPNDPSVLEEALQAYERALEIDPKNPAIAMEATDVLIAQERPEQAIALLERYELVPRDYPGFWGALALSYAEAGEFDRARPLVERALQNSADDPRALQADELLRGRGAA